MNLENFYNKSIPILNWVFFESENEAFNTFNSIEFCGWNNDWVPLATDQLGDIIVLNNLNHIGYVNHEERGNPSFNLISKTSSKIEELLSNLIEIEHYSNVTDIIELRDIKKKILMLRKQAPRSLKEYFTYEIEELQDKINDIKFYSTEDGKVIKALEEYSQKIFDELRVNSRYLGISIEKDFESNEPKFFVSGWLEKDESLDEIMEVIKRYKSPYPLDVRKIYTYDEMMEFQKLGSQEI